MKKICFVLIGVLLISLNNCYVHAENEVFRRFYVNPAIGNDLADGTQSAPFKTLEKVKTAVRGINSYMTGDIEVYLAGGIYEINETIHFTAEDSGKNGFKIVYKTTEQPVLSGGISISGWELYDEKNNIYRVNVGNQIVRQMYINGKRAVRARSDGSMGIKVSSDMSGCITEDADIANWSRPSDIEVVFKKQFYSPRCVVQSVSSTQDGTFLTFNSAIWYTMTVGYGDYMKFTSGDEAWYIENAYELLDEEGEWYHNREDGYMYYKPYPTENMSDADVILPACERLLSVEEGASNIKFSGIAFENAAWNYPTENHGHTHTQNGMLVNSNATPEAGVSVSDAKNIEFSGCSFTKMGSSGLNILRGSKNITVTDNVFTELSGAGANIGEVSGDSRNPSEEEDIVENITFENNRIYDTSKEFYGASALGVGYVRKSSFSYNKIYNQPYTGIHIGWGWSFSADSVIEQVKVKGNCISDVMTVLRDGGGIYTLGASNAQEPLYTNEITENYIKRVYEGGSIYSDNGSCGWHIYNNVIDQRGIDNEKVLWYNGAYDAHDNKIESNFSTLEKYNTRDGVNVIYSGNIICKNADWRQEAWDIIGKAEGREYVALESIIDKAILNGGEKIAQDCIVLVNNSDVTLNTATISRGLCFSVMPIGKIGVLTISFGTKYKIDITPSNVIMYVDNAVYQSKSFDGLICNAPTSILLYADNGLINLKIGNDEFCFYTAVSEEGNYKIAYSGERCAAGKIKHEANFYKQRENSIDFDGNNLLSGGSFETGIDGWTNSFYANPSYSNLITESGIGSMRVEHAPEDDFTDCYVESPVVSLKKNTRYKLSVDIYINGETEDGTEISNYAGTGCARMYMKTNAENSFYGGDWLYHGMKGDERWYKEGSTHNINEGWNKIKTYFTLSEDAGDCKIFVIVADENNPTAKLVYYLDNFCLVAAEEKGDSENFENGIGDWYKYGATIGANTENTYGQSAGAMEVNQTVPYGEVRKPVYLLKGHRYKITVKFKNPMENDQNPWIRIYNTGNTNDDIIDLGDESATRINARAGEWCEIKRKYTHNLGDALCYIAVVSQGSGLKTWYLDNFEVCDMDSGDLLSLSEVTDGSYSENFENGIGAWYKYGATAKASTENTYGQSAGAMEVNQTIPYGEVRKPVYLLRGHKYEIRVKFKNPMENGQNPWIRIYDTGNTNDDIISIGEEKTSKSNIPGGSWGQISRIYTHNRENKLCYIAVVSQGEGLKTWYLDDFEVCDMGWSQTRRSFLYGLADWYTNGQAASVLVNTAKVIQNSAEDVLCKDFTIQTKQKYAVTAEVKMVSGTGIARMAVKPKYNRLSEINVSTGWQPLNNAYSDNSIMVNDTEWTTIGSSVIFESNDISAFDAMVYAIVQAGSPAEYYLRNVRFVPIDDSKHAGIYSVSFDENGSIDYTCEGYGDYYGIGYRYINSQDGDVLNAGYIFPSDMLPVVGGNVILELMPCTMSGEREATVRTNRRESILRINQLLLKNGENTCGVINDVLKGTNVYGYINYSNTSVYEPNVSVIVAGYDDDGKLVGLTITEKKLVYGEHIELSTAENGLYVTNDISKISLFLFEEDKITPICKSVSIK